MYTYQLTIKRWIDGDTVEASVDLGFGVYTIQRFRLLDLDTPERGQPGYVAARNCAEWIHPAHTKVIVTTIKGTDKYGRWLVSLPLVNEAMAKAKLLKADIDGSNNSTPIN